jgi:LCP family protein required for cell wall assembly
VASLHRRRHGVPWLRALLWCILFVAFLLTGFQTGYRLQTYLGDLLAVVRISPGRIAFSPPSTLLTTGRPEEGQEGLPQWSGKGRVNILILGTDRRDKEERAARTDTMMVASLDPVARRVLILSIPRDLWVFIPGYGEGRINTAHFYGELNGAQGPTLAKETVEANLGIPIDYYVLLDFEGFKEIVDTLGGVTIDVEAPIRDDMFPDASYGYKTIYIPAGRQEMDGEMLLQYVRTRHGGDDFERMRRQQQALWALAQRALSLNLLPRLPALINTALDAISTDIQPLEILALANLGSQIGLDGLEMKAIDESLTTPFVTLDGAQILLSDKAGIEAMLEELFAPSTSLASLENRSEEVRIVIRNGTAQVGLAEEVADLLYRRGFDVQKYIDLEAPQYEETVIASREESMESARNLAGLLGIDRVLLTSFEGEDADITILLGRGFAFP